MSQESGIRAGYLTGAPLDSRQIRHTPVREVEQPASKRVSGSQASSHRWLSPTDDDGTAAWKPGKQGLSEASAAMS